ncbi:MAG TPA: PIN domain-containing protein [Chloroflexi bacterium]|nr:PIN domain-containing protein [Chloroflexota bacterium]
MSAEVHPCIMLDSNIWLYAFIDQDAPLKQTIARNPLRRQMSVVVSTQIINEVCFNLLRKARFTEKQIGRMVRAFYQRYTIVPIDQESMIVASQLRSQYSLSFWDGFIVAAAHNAGCDILYTEDLQHGLVIDGRLRIENPFAAKQ